MRQTRCYVDGAICVACLQFFGTRTRVVTHLEDKSERCKQVVLSSMPRVSADKLILLDRSDAQEAKSLVHAGRSRVFSKVPVVRLPGPYTLEAHRAGISHACGLQANKPI